MNRLRVHGPRRAGRGSVYPSLRSIEFVPTVTYANDIELGCSAVQVRWLRWILIVLTWRPRR
jgi:hypothetical protein